MKYFTIILFIAILILGCNRKTVVQRSGSTQGDTVVTVSEAASVIQENPSSDMGEEQASESSSAQGFAGYYRITNADGLRMRDTPSLDGQEVALLPLGTLLNELNPSEAPQEIGEHKAYWYRVSTLEDQSITGWVYGAFLDVHIPTELVDREHQSYFPDHPRVDIGQFPEEKLPAFGIGYEGELYIPQDKEAVFLEGNLLFRGVPHSYETFTIQITAPSGEHFNLDYGTSDSRGFFIDDVNSITDPEQMDDIQKILVVRFINFAAFESGKWSYSITAGEEELIMGEVYIDSRDISVLNRDNPNPLLGHGQSDRTAFREESINIWGKTSLSNQNIRLVVYYNTDELIMSGNLGYTKLVPAAATEVNTDDRGLFSLSFRVGADLPPGNYYFAYGKEEVQLSMWHGFHIP